MSFLSNAQSVSISGGVFNTVQGDQTNYYDNSRTEIRDAFNTHHNNYSNSFNDNSSRTSGTRFSTKSSPGVNGHASYDSPFGPGFPFTKGSGGPAPPSARPTAHQWNTEPAPVASPQSPFDSLHPSTAAKVERAVQRAVDASSRGGSNISRSFNQETKNVTGSYNDNSKTTNNYYKNENHHSVDSHDDNRNYSRTTFDQSYHDSRDQSTRDSYNNSGNRNDERTTITRQDLRDQSTHIDNSQNSRTDNRAYDNHIHNDNRKYNDSHNRSNTRVNNDFSTTNVDNSKVNQNTVSGGITNSGGVMNFNSPTGNKSNNPFTNNRSPPSSPPRDEDQGIQPFASNAPRLTPRATSNGSQQDISSSSRRSTGGSVEQVKTPQGPAPAAAPSLEEPPIRPEARPIQAPEGGRAPEPPSASVRPRREASPPVVPPQPRPEEQPAGQEGIDNLSNVLVDLFIDDSESVGGSKGAEEGKGSRPTSPETKEKMRKRDKFKNFFHKKDKDAKIAKGK